MNRAVVVVATTAAMILIAALSRVPYHPDDSDHASLRFSWRARGDRTETCRDRTHEELEKLPVHMRTPQVCEGESVEYELTVSIDGDERIDKEIHPAGAKGDRPLFVLEELRLEPGRHELHVRFQHGERAAFAMDTTVDLARGQIALVTIDHATNRFVVILPTPGSGRNPTQ
jgi:hypothetical protein